MIIWCSTVVVVIVVYDIIKHLLQLHFSQRLRCSMALLVVASIYPHYYAWWSLFNAVNDEYYEQILHQVSHRPTYSIIVEKLFSLKLVLRTTIMTPVKPQISIFKADKVLPSGL
jgi:hypothetical protein